MFIKRILKGGEKGGIRSQASSPKGHKVHFFSSNCPFSFFSRPLLHLKEDLASVQEKKMSTMSKLQGGKFFFLPFEILGHFFFNQNESTRLLCNISILRLLFLNFLAVLGLY